MGMGPYFILRGVQPKFLGKLFGDRVYHNIRLFENENLAIFAGNSH